MLETIGKRIAFQRQTHGWTQQSLADRLAMSRVAISHIEMDLTVPSERSITLMAGIFKQSPTELVEGTTYPRAKAERLPEVANLYTELELQHALMINDTEWLRQLNNPTTLSKNIHQTLEKWLPRLEQWKLTCLDDRERRIILQMSRLLDELMTHINHDLA
jgi:transcriptional regulator with XRE-family HTH domain